MGVRRGDRGDGGFLPPGGPSAALLAIQAAPFSDSKDGRGKNLSRGLPQVSLGCLFDWVSSLLFCCCCFLIFLAALHSMWDLSSLVKD